MIIHYLICDHCQKDVALTDWPFPEVALNKMGFYIVGDKHYCKRCKKFLNKLIDNMVMTNA